VSVGLTICIHTALWIKTSSSGSNGFCMETGLSQKFGFWEAYPWVDLDIFGYYATKLLITVACTAET